MKMSDHNRNRRINGPIAYDFAPKRPSAASQTQDTIDTKRQEVLPVESAEIRARRPSRMTMPLNCWCKCGKCHPMPYEEEYVCCQELQFPRKDLEEETCITLDEEFDKICLTRAVLEVSVVMQRYVQGLLNAVELPNKSLRFTAYRAFIAWTHGYLGKGNRRPLPACAAWLIRDSFPEEENLYRGYRNKNCSEIQDAFES